MQKTLKLGDEEFTAIYVETALEHISLQETMRDVSVVVFDLETDGLYPFLGNRATGAAFYFPERNCAYYVPYRHPDTKNFNSGWLRSVGNEMLNRKSVITWNGKFDMLFMYVDDVKVLDRTYVLEDVMIALHLLDENRWLRGLNYKLKDCAKIFISADAADEQVELKAELKQRGLKSGEIGRLPAELVADYAMMDVILTWKMRQFLMPALERWHMTDLYYEQNNYLQTAILRMEINGMPIDRQETKRRIDMNEVETARLLAEIQALAGYPINPNSPQQVAAWLHTKDARRKTLEARQEYDPRARLLIDHKFVSKANNTFYGPYLAWSEADGKIHPSINITGTVTGRLSSSEPNLQQVPRKSPRYNVKEVFVAPDDYVLVQFDYKQLELRLACYFSGEPTMTKMFLSGEDMHQYTADQLGVSRHIGKTANFGFLYGMGIEKAAPFLNVQLEDARDIVLGWRNLYPAFRKAHKSVMEKAQEWRDESGKPAIMGRGWRYIRLMDGRCRHYLNDDANFFDSWNSLVQGTGAIVTRRGIQRMVDAYPENDVMLPCMTVHDSFLAFVKRSWLKRVLYKARQLMTDFPNFTPPMAIDAEYGTSWGKVHKQGLTQKEGIYKWRQVCYNARHMIDHPSEYKGT